MWQFLTAGTGNYHREWEMNEGGKFFPEQHKFINTEWLTESENHHFGFPNVKTDPGKDHQWMLNAQAGQEDTQGFQESPRGLCTGKRHL